MSKQMSEKADKQQKSAIVRVLGCKVNQAEAAAMAQILEDHGYCLESDAQDPDLVVVNTCCVTSKAEGKSRRAVGRLVEKYPHARVMVTGCLAEIHPRSLDRAARDAVILGTYEKDRFQEVLERDVLHTSEDSSLRASGCTTFGDLGAPGIAGRTRAFLKVQDGCSQRCSYCIVPFARGPARSLERSTALSHARALSSNGHAEIVLTGIHLGNYGRDLDESVDLADLVEELLSECPDVRFRLSSIEPQEITQRLIDLMAKQSRLCRHLHIPLQSGDDAILKRMRRPYTAKSVNDLAEAVLHAVPDACLGFDVMVGFPGEDEPSFRKTVHLVQSLGAGYLHVFPFSPRPGTPAATFEPVVPESLARERVGELRQLSEQMRERFYSRFVGRFLRALVESESETRDGTLVARTDNYIPVKIKKNHDTQEKGLFDLTVERVENGEVYGV
jgi:threonylcarbamoyladenosine tRNA methylthiotransferase MtaB